MKTFKTVSRRKKRTLEKTQISFGESLGNCRVPERISMAEFNARMAAIGYEYLMIG